MVYIIDSDWVTEIGANITLMGIVIKNMTIKKTQNEKCHLLFFYNYEFINYTVDDVKSEDINIWDVMGIICSTVGLGSLLNTTDRKIQLNVEQT